MDWGFIFTCLSIPTSIYGIYELIKKVKLKLKNSNSKSVVWKSKTDWVIIVPQYTGRYRRVEDIIASEKIYTHCNKLGLQCTIQDDSQPIPVDKNLILVCGPKANRATQGLYNDFKIKFESNNNITILMDMSSGSKYESKLNEETKNIERDFAVLSRYIDPNTKRICIFCAGLHGLGTLGSAEILTGSQLVKYAKKSESFESIVSVSAIDNFFSIGSIEFIIPPRNL